jgi:hypothetical protein
MSTRTFYLLACRQCGGSERGPIVMPFGSASERGGWAAGHTRATSHDQWWVHDQVREDDDDDGNDEPEAVTVSVPHAYCTVHDQPLEWCQAGYLNGDGSLPCSAGEGVAARAAAVAAPARRKKPGPWCLEHDQALEWCRHPPVAVRHQPRRGDDVEAWLESWRDSQDAEVRLTLGDMINDYRLHADTGTLLGDEVPRHE